MKKKKRRKSRRTEYKYSISLQTLKIKNMTPEEFADRLRKIKYRAYAVEQIKDGRKVIITKPGGKGQHDFMVWVYDKQKDKNLWLISHKNIYEDLREKGRKNPRETIKIIKALKRVYNGENPKELKISKLKNPCGLPPELLLKVYKWIWGQEDCNYPPPKYKGRTWSWEGLKKEKGRFKKTGKGIVDLQKKLE